ncbi:hypothetical protein ACT453_58180, partial [Bacillus sp. D-CC]
MKYEEELASPLSISEVVEKKEELTEARNVPPLNILFLAPFHLLHTALLKYEEELASPLSISEIVEKKEELTE